jgi:hypothetical protein
MSNPRRHRITHAAHEPPVNELPVVLGTPELAWRGDGIVFAIPSLLIYTTGVEILILCRTRYPQIKNIENARASADALRNLVANGMPVELLSGGERHEHGLTYRAWVSFASGGLDVRGGDLRFALEWPGVEPAEHQVPHIRELAAGAVILWELT